MWKEQWLGSEVAWGGRTISTFDGKSMLASMRDLPAGHPQSVFAEKWLRGGGDDFLKLWFLAAEELQTDPSGPLAADAARRLRAAEEAMTARFESGELKSFGRPVIGGALSPISQDLWRSDFLSSRWRSCQIDMWHPFGKPAGWQDNLHWIFVVQSDLQRVLSTIEAQRRPPAEEAVAKLAETAVSEGPKSAAARSALLAMPERDLLEMQLKTLKKSVDDYCAQNGLPTPGNRVLREMRKTLLFERSQI